MEKLWNQDGLWTCGGYTRYNVTSDPESSSGPWPGVTLMVARAAVATGQWDVFTRAMDWIERIASPTWTMFEHFDYAAKDRTNRRWYRGGIIPWLSYAEPSMLFVNDLLGFRPTLDRVAIQPRLPPHLARMSARVRYRGRPVEIEIVNRGSTCRSVTLNGKTQDTFDARGATFAPFDGPARVEMVFR
jgi:hypothetical protein